ncbi:MAG TPA: FkbM family methyltransferase [Chitinophagaceae bacterium]|nr:FkbM family methyltransferase [Chitinophagaceae bacterium]
MKLTRILGKFIAYLYFLAKYRSHTVAYAFANNNIPLKATSFVHRKGGMLVFDGNKENSFPVHAIRYFNHPQLHFLVNLLNNPGVSVAEAGNGKVTFRVNGVIYPVSSQANLSVVNEMFFDNYYNISTTQPCVLLDIGMNVGYASLYFSSFPNVKRIYSYEPFEETYTLAKQNFSLNKPVSEKISAYNYGISNYTGSVDVPMLEGGSVIASTEQSFIKDHNIHSTSSITVKVRDILDVLNEIRMENPGQQLALKIDCEGEEYNILETMHANKGFEKVIFLCIEWHFKGSARIMEILHQNNFTVFDIPKSAEGEYGMIYGFRTAGA